MKYLSESIHAVLLGSMILTALSCAKRNGQSEAEESSAMAPGEEEPTVYHVKGIVEEIRQDGKTAVIHHEEIPGYMQEMTMPLPVKDAAELKGVEAGDRISFRMLVTETDGWIDEVKVIGEIPTTEFRPTTRIVRDVEPLSEGDAMPDYPLTNELGQAVSLHDFKGEALAFTFIFTRCPFPTFCPQMNKNFQEAYQKLTSMEDAPDNWHLLSVSFDVEHDTPEVLRNYATQYDYDTNHWNFATGALIEIDAITEQFGMFFSRDEGTFNFSHNLRTVVVDAGGEIQEILIGNMWTSDELVGAILKAARADAGGESAQE